MSTLIMAGSQVGTIIGFMGSGVLVDCWGWEAVFYFQVTIKIKSSLLFSTVLL